jgi:hypothetical protein
MNILNPGESHLYTTKPFFDKTYLFVSAKDFDPFPPPGTSVAWHKQLCCEDDHTQNINLPTETIDISAGGALVSVWNNGTWPIWCRTNWI